MIEKDPNSRDQEYSYKSAKIKWADAPPPGGKLPEEPVTERGKRRHNPGRVK